MNQEADSRKLNRWLLVGGVAGLLAVVFGAFGAHGIEQAIPGWYGKQDLPSVDESKDAEAHPEWYALDQLHQKKLKTWITGVRYHFYHVFAILAVGMLQLSGRYSNRKLNLAGLLFLLGTIGFSGSIYLYVITKIKILGMTAALGGVIFLSGWLFFVLAVWRPSETNENKAG